MPDASVMPVSPTERIEIRNAGAQKPGIGPGSVGGVLRPPPYIPPGMARSTGLLEGSPNALWKLKLNCNKIPGEAQ